MLEFERTYYKSIGFSDQEIERLKTLPRKHPAGSLEDNVSEIGKLLLNHRVSNATLPPAMGYAKRYNGETTIDLINRIYNAIKKYK